LVHGRNCMKTMDLDVPRTLAPLKIELGVP